MPQEGHERDCHLLAPLKGERPLQPPHQLLEAKVRLDVSGIDVHERAEQVDHARVELVPPRVQEAAQEPLQPLAGFGVARELLLGSSGLAALDLGSDAPSELAALRPELPGLLESAITISEEVPHRYAWAEGAVMLESGCQI